MENRAQQIVVLGCRSHHALSSPFTRSFLLSPLEVVRKKIEDERERDKMVFVGFRGEFPEFSAAAAESQMKCFRSFRRSILNASFFSFLVTISEGAFHLWGLPYMTSAMGGIEVGPQKADERNKLS